MEEVGPHKPVRIRLVRGGLSHPFFADVMALDLSRDLGPAVKLITDDAANFRAMELAAKLTGSPGNTFGAVYLIAPEDEEIGVVKIGIATDPRLRLCGLQIGNWNKLAVKGLLWVDAGQGAIERLAHQAAAEMDISIRGEWIEASVKEAAELVLKAARYAKHRCYDSDMWLKNWAARVDALAYAKRNKVWVA